MNDANAIVRRRSSFLWAGTALLIGFNLYAGLQGDRSLILAALALTGLFAICGIAFGIWAALRLNRRRD